MILYGTSLFDIICPSLGNGFECFQKFKIFCGTVHAHTGSAKIIQGAMYCKGLAQINEEN